MKKEGRGQRGVTIISLQQGGEDFLKDLISGMGFFFEVSNIYQCGRMGGHQG